MIRNVKKAELRENENNKKGKNARKGKMGKFIFLFEKFQSEKSTFLKSRMTLAIYIFVEKTTKSKMQKQKKKLGVLYSGILLSWNFMVIN